MSHASLAGRLAERLAEGFTCLFNWPSVIQGAEERACALALAIMDGARTLREAGLKKYAGGYTWCALSTLLHDCII